MWTIVLIVAGIWTVLGFIIFLNIMGSIDCFNAKNI